MALDTERAQFLDYLKSRGMRRTEERMALFEEIYRQHGHIDADALLSSLEDAGRKISRATVYRNLDLLVECGLVTKQRLGGDRYLYEHVHAAQHHDHLVCSECGRVVEFISPAIGALLGEICRAHDFSKAHHRLQISGLCNGCAERRAGDDEPSGDEQRSRMGAVALGLFLAFATLLPALLGAETVERRVAVMGTHATVRVESADRERALAASEAAIDALDETAVRLSTWTGDSELARLNGAPAGAPHVVSHELAAELAAAERCRVATDGAFDPRLGALVAAWGLRSGGRRPAAEEIDAGRAALSEARLELATDSAGRPVAVRHGALVLEEGAWGKGAGLDRAVAAARQAGALEAEIDLGGQVAFFGEPGGAPTAILLAHPDDRRPVAQLAVDGGSVATSGNGERGIVVDGQKLGHLLDPRTGEPAPDFGSLTVWAPTGLDADCLATGLYVLGPDEGLARAEALPGVEAVALVRGDGGQIEVRATRGLAGRLETLIDAGAVDAGAVVDELDFNQEDRRARRLAGGAGSPAT